MLATTLCRDSANSGDKGYFRRFRGMHPGRMPCEGVRPQIVRDKMGHVGYRRDPFCLQQELMGRGLIDTYEPDFGV
jgi:hypothetical protein